MRKLFKNKIFLVLLVAALILAGLTIATAGGRSRVTWLEDAVNSVAQPLQKFSIRSSNAIITLVERMFKTSDADKENDQLRARIAQYETIEAEMRDLRQENERLRTLLNFADTDAAYAYVTAPVIGRSQGIWFHEFTVGAGRSQGISEDMAVVNAAGLVGRVTSVSANTCKVTAIIDSTSDVSVMVERTRDYGFVRGTLSVSSSNIMELYYIPTGSDLVPGDVIMTSGIDGVFPKGLAVGVVTEVARSSENAEDKDALVQPSVNFLRLEEVLILTHLEKEN
ncbi:MAG: rod shape-determining protein MreC [Christensenellaceae bacterium]|jgi:rod shape-determining protein MreC|nr:rod shape-determining protein MreC [Christensenellaceae bacterium]